MLFISFRFRYETHLGTIQSAPEYPLVPCIVETSRASFNSRGRYWRSCFVKLLSVFCPNGGFWDGPGSRKGGLKGVLFEVAETSRVILFNRFLQGHNGFLPSDNLAKAKTRLSSRLQVPCAKNMIFLLSRHCTIHAVFNSMIRNSYKTFRHNYLSCYVWLSSSVTKATSATETRNYHSGKRGYMYSVHSIRPTSLYSVMDVENFVFLT